MRFTNAIPEMPACSRRSCASEERKDFGTPIASMKSIQACQRNTTTPRTRTLHTVDLLHDILQPRSLDARTERMTVAMGEMEVAGQAADSTRISKLKLLPRLSRPDQGSQGCNRATGTRLVSKNSASPADFWCCAGSRFHRGGRTTAC